MFLESSGATSQSLLRIFVCLCLASGVLGDVALPQDDHLIDLSWPYTAEHTLGWFNKSFEMNMIHSGLWKYNGHEIWMQTEEISLAIHSGTHMDAPLHFVKDNWSVDEIPLSHFVNRPLVVIDVSKKVVKDNDYGVTVDDILNWEEQNGRIPEGGVIFFRTGFAKRYLKGKLQYMGTVSQNHALIHTPGVSPEAAKWIVANRLVVGVGLDAISLDPGQGEQFLAHRTILERNMYVIENLASSLDRVPVTGAKVNIYPMLIERASGAPCRVIVDTSLAPQFAPSTMLLVVTGAAFVLSYLV